MPPLPRGIKREFPGLLRFPLDLDGDVGGVGQDELFDFEAQFPDREGVEQALGELLRKSFEEFARTFAGEIADVLRHVEIIYGAGDVVGRGGLGETGDAHFQVDEQALRLRAFLVGNADAGPDFEVNDADEIGHDRGEFGSVG
jgi:hypothetical protein